MISKVYIENVYDILYKCKCFNIFFIFYFTEIAKNPSFMLSTLGFTCVAFVTGALAWWGPTFIHLGLKMQPETAHIELNE